MKRASSLFSDPDRVTIETAIAAAERGTRGQIVPVVASVSGRYDRAEDLFGMMFALLCLAGAWLTLQDTSAVAWSGTQTTVLGLPAVGAIVVAGFVCGAWLAGRVTVLRLPFIARAEMQAEVERAAQAAFHNHNVRKTSAASGVLIYVSLYEQMVRVIGDDAVAERVSPEQWQAICQAVVDGMQRGAPAAGLVEALERAGALLATVLPREADGDNELNDHLIVLD